MVAGDVSQDLGFVVWSKFIPAFCLRFTYASSFDSVLCPDYDLCEDCIKKGGHREGHQMIEITDPDDRAIMAEEVRPRGI